MKEAVRELNILMVDFNQHWERENTTEMFLQISGSGDTSELELNVAKNSERLSAIEKHINNPDNFDDLIESWDLIDLKLLDSLIDFFGIDIEAFELRVKDSKVKPEIKDFFK